VERSLPRWLRADHQVHVFHRGASGTAVDVTEVACDSGSDTPATLCVRPGTTSYRCDGVEVTVRVPVLFPGITSERFRLTRAAELPRTG
jgi:hypothetical protein